MLFLITYYPIYLLQNTWIFLFLFSVNGAFNPLLWHVEEIHIVWNDYSCDHNHNDSGNAMHKSFRPYVLPPAFAIKTLLYVALFQILGLKVTSKVIIKSKTRQQKKST